MSANCESRIWSKFDKRSDNKVPVEGSTVKEEDICSDQVDIYKQILVCARDIVSIDWVFAVLPVLFDVLSFVFLKLVAYSVQEQPLEFV
jgi:hypothetical protein